MKLEKINENEIRVGDKIWIKEDEFFYPGIIREINKHYISVYKYALGIYIPINTAIHNLFKRYENISYDIFINRGQYVNRARH